MISISAFFKVYFQKLYAWHRNPKHSRPLHNKKIKRSFIFSKHCDNKVKLQKATYQVPNI